MSHLRLCLPLGGHQRRRHMRLQECRLLTVATPAGPQPLHLQKYTPKSFLLALGSLGFPGAWKVARCQLQDAC